MKNTDHYLAFSYQQTVTLEECTDGSPCYVARVIELPGCESHGTTQADALAVMRAKIVLLTAEGLENKEIGERFDMPRTVVSKWRKRFFLERLAGLEDR